MIFKPGDLVVRGNYSIIDFVGRGGFAEVYKARDTRLEALRAIKVIKPGGAGSTADEFSDYQQRFIEEARAGAQIRDDAVIGVITLEEEGDLTLLVTEFAEGGSLADKIAAGPMSPEEVINIGAQVCKGLAAIHRPPLSAVHRDIKPSNILFGEAQRAKVADLGLVQIYGASVRSQGTAGKHPGTPSYMSPEQETTSGYLTPASDLYSLGCVLFEALTQQNYQQYARLHPGARVRDLRPEVPAVLEAVIEKALAQEPSDRFTDADSMRKALEECRAPKAEAEAFFFRGGGMARTPEQWGEIAEQRFDDGVFHLSQGQLEPWLTRIGRADLAGLVDAIRKRQRDPELALHEALNALLQDKVKPELSMEAVSLDYGSIQRGERRTLRVTVSNRGRGLLVGQATAKAPWIQVPRPAIHCRAASTQVIELTLVSSGMPEGASNADPAVEITTNGGQAALSAQVHITWSPTLSVLPKRLSFGTFLKDSSPDLRPLALTLVNSGGGRLEGEITTTAEWLAISPRCFELPGGQRLEVQVTADPSTLLELGDYRAEIRVASDAGSSVVQARIDHRSRELLPQVRWQNWALFLLLGAAVVAGWAVPLALGLRWLLGIEPKPEMWKLIVVGAAPIVSILVALLAIPRFSQPLDAIENFHHRADLAGELRGREQNWLRRLLFGLLVAGAAAGLIAAQSKGMRLPIAPLKFQLPLIALGPVAGLIFGLLLVDARLPGRPAAGARQGLSWLRAIAMAVVTPLLYLSIWPGGAKLGSLSLAAAAGFLVSADSFAWFPVRLQWLYGRLKPLLPTAVLLSLWFIWARGSLKVAGPSLQEYYLWHGRQVSMPGNSWGHSLLFLLGILVLVVLGLWLDTTRGYEFRSSLKGCVAALVWSGIPAYLGYALLVRLVSVRAERTAAQLGAGWGILGIALALVVSVAVLWALSAFRLRLADGLAWLSARAGGLLARAPGVADRLPRRVRVPGLQEGPGVTDYLAGKAAIPPLANSVAVLTWLFALPAVYRVATLLHAGTCLAVVVVLLVVAVAAGVVIFVLRRANVKR